MIPGRLYKEHKLCELIVNTLNCCVVPSTVPDVVCAVDAYIFNQQNFPKVLTELKEAKMVKEATERRVPVTTNGFTDYDMPIHCSTKMNKLCV